MTPRRWVQGRATLDAMLAEGRLERVPPSREQADLLIAQAEAHISSARAIAATDPAGGGSARCGSARTSRRR
jgi:hypothetical protein